MNDKFEFSDDDDDEYKRFGDDLDRAVPLLERIERRGAREAECEKFWRSYAASSALKSALCAALASALAAGVDEIDIASELAEATVIIEHG